MSHSTAGHSLTKPIAVQSGMYARHVEGVETTARIDCGSTYCRAEDEPVPCGLLHLRRRILLMVRSSDKQMQVGMDGTWRGTKCLRRYPFQHRPVGHDLLQNFVMNETTTRRRMTSRLLRSITQRQKSPHSALTILHGIELETIHVE